MGKQLPLVTDIWPGVDVEKVRKLLADDAFVPTLFLLHASSQLGGDLKTLLKKSWTVFMIAAHGHVKQKGYSSNVQSAAFKIANGQARLP